jgi:ribosome recycling factor
MRVPIPELNAERRKELVKVAHKYAEAAKVAVRHVRRDGIDALKKAVKDGALGEDDEKRQETAVQKLTDETVVEIDKMLAAKEQDILKV